MDTIRTVTCIALTTVAASLGFVVDSEGQVGNTTGIVNPNLAGEEELLTLQHVNRGLVSQIVDQRPFLSVLDPARLAQPVTERGPAE